MLGGALGSWAQKGIGTLFGMGDYKEALASELGVESSAIEQNASPSVNSLTKPLSTNEAVPFMHSDMEGAIRIVRREFVDVIQIGGSAIVRIFVVSPTTSLFPWLSGLADNWQTWSVSGFAAEYVPTSGVAVGGTNAALGQVSMAYVYNVDEQNGQFPATSLQGILNQNGSVSGSPAAPSTCLLECDPKRGGANAVNPIRFVETETLLSAYYSEADLEAATLIVRTEGSQATTPFQCGQLWVTYEITLYQPRAIKPPVTFYDMPSYSKFRALRLRQMELNRDTGPWTLVELAKRNAERRAIKDEFETREHKAAYNQAEYDAEMQCIDELEHQRKQASAEVQRLEAEFLPKEAKPEKAEPPDRETDLVLVPSFLGATRK